MSKKNIAIVMGGYSSEAQISLKSGRTVFENLDRTIYEPYAVEILRDSWHCVLADGSKIAINKADFSIEIDSKTIFFDAVFNTIHGTPGENGLFQAYLELLDIPQTASDFYQAALTFNKRDCISALKPYGIKTATNYYLNQGDVIDEKAIVERVGLPCFVKANRAGSSFGISKVYEAENLKDAIAISFKEDNEVIIESFLEGTEVSIGVVEYEGQVMALPATEIVSENDFFDYDAKYEGKSQEITPARISEIQAQALKQQAETIFKVLKLKGITRAEFIFHNGEPHFLEINTTPGLTPASLIPQQAKVAGISLQDLFGEMITNVLKEEKNS
ncbi:D-alanine--D-alanine ligase [Flavimarina sp. Hel_I_48]|uniref:D-alanine--D-alanine ligase n=1 Tax=Flavimarina sp. Hel_I_48 TaxID=1392488 RepID=UPI0004DF5927|nr:D-alanine--D-alanine ligase [Flavimarina sp. Hel_I_48]